MRHLPLALAVVLGALTASARADIAPPPKCEAGKHHEYLYGHRCVLDGYHAAALSNGTVVIVKDGEEPKEIVEPPTPSASTTKPSTSVSAPPSTPTAVPTPTPTAVATPTPTAVATPTPTAPPNPPPAKKEGCVYGDGAGADDGAMLATIAVAAALSILRRRRVQTGRGAFAKPRRWSPPRAHGLLRR